MNFLEIFQKNTKISNFTKICPVGAELFHADGKTDRTKLILAFRLRNLNVREVGHISLFRWRECEDPVHLKREIGTCFELWFLN